MKSLAIALAVATASLGFASGSFAQGGGQYGDRTESQLPPTYQGNRGAQPTPSYVGPSIQRDEPQRDLRRDNRQDPRWDDRRDQRREQRRDDRRDQRDDRFGHGGSHYPHGGSHYSHGGSNYSQGGPRYYRGGYLPAPYRSHQYVVNDWRAHRLSSPPRGHHWVQIGADYALVAIATGVIAQLLLSPY